MKPINRIDKKPIMIQIIMLEKMLTIYTTL
jgi:hypothetical protein